MAYRLLLFISALLLSKNSSAVLYFHDNTAKFSVYQNDKRIFDENKLKELKADDAYDYTEEVETPNWWTDFKEWVLLQMEKIFGDNFQPGSFLFQLVETLPYIIPAIAVIIIIYYIIKTNPGSQVMRQHDNSKVILTEEEELLMERNLDQLVDEAISQNELRLAVRYMYLSCIKRLDMKRLIKYANDKTNYEYVREIRFSEVSLHFKSLTLAYEQIWYGQMVFDKAYFKKYKDNYEQFHILLDQKQYAQA